MPVVDRIQLVGLLDVPVELNKLVEYPVQVAGALPDVAEHRGMGVHSRSRQRHCAALDVDRRAPVLAFELQLEV